VPAVKLRSAGSASTCSGKLTLTLTVKTRIKKGKKVRKISRTVPLGTGSFVIPPGKTVIVKLKLNARGRALLKAGHGRLNARLTILRSSPSPAQTKAVDVTIVPQKTVKVKQPKK